ncbi:DUF6207 family protein [Streptomyces himalayensis]|uniref:DUF6207 family protein n=1 Tax=Streptomyces himalayensis TaxID=2820085 RepID=UPI001C69ADB2|nr:DUF6207 family protein [Streptomyces himalayensis]
MRSATSTTTLSRQQKAAAEPAHHRALLTDQEPFAAVPRPATRRSGDATTTRDPGEPGVRLRMYLDLRQESGGSARPGLTGFRVARVRTRGGVGWSTSSPAARCDVRVRRQAVWPCGGRVRRGLPGCRRRWQRLPRPSTATVFVLMGGQFQGLCPRRL